MTPASGWWCIPLGVVALVALAAAAPSPASPPAPAPARPVAAPQPAAALPAGVALRDASGRRRAGPVALPAGALCLQLPAAWAGERVQTTLWRSAGGRREAVPWLQFTSRVRADGSVPIAGLAAGRYDAEVVRGEGAAASAAAAAGFAAPGAVVLEPAPAAAGR